MAEPWSDVAARTTAVEAAQDGPEAEAEAAEAAAVVEHLARTAVTNECRTALFQANPLEGTEAGSQGSIAAVLAQTSTLPSACMCASRTFYTCGTRTTGRSAACCGTSRRPRDELRKKAHTRATSWK